MKEQNNKDFYINFKQRIDETHSFPSNYLFKFIVPNKEEPLYEITKIFEKSNADIIKKESKNNNYISCSIKLYVTDSDEIIKYYKEASKINNIILL